MQARHGKTSTSLSGSIGKIVIDRGDSNIVFGGVPGDAWSGAFMKRPMEAKAARRSGPSPVKSISRLYMWRCN
ncbi:MAG TPA: hypothetical protein VGL56_06380 [Fimbriimonadaceae bacterium]|jgi:hypothetical protein